MWCRCYPGCDHAAQPQPYGPGPGGKTEQLESAVGCKYLADPEFPGSTQVPCVALTAFQVLRPHIVVIDLVDDATRRSFVMSAGQLAPVTTRLTTQERKSQHAVRHPQEELAVKEHVGCGWRLAVHEGRLRRVPPHLELVLQPAALSEEGVRRAGRVFSHSFLSGNLVETMRHITLSVLDMHLRSGGLE